MIAQETFSRLMRRSNGPPVVHRFKERKVINGTLAYIATCGARAFDITGIKPRGVTCGKCLKIMKEMAE